MLVIPADNRILYFRRDREMFEFLSHFYLAPILLDGDTWPTVEHYLGGAYPHGNPSGPAIWRSLIAPLG